MCIPIAADTPFDPRFLSLSHQWYSSDTPSHLYTNLLSISLAIDSESNPIYPNGTDHIDRTINGVTYSADTVTYRRDPYSPSGTMYYKGNLLSLFDSTYTASDVIRGFQYFDIYFLINFYGQAGLEFPIEDLSMSEAQSFVGDVYIEGLKPSGTGLTERHYTYFPCTVVDSGYRDSNNQRSYTMILHATYYRPDLTEYYIVPVFGFSINPDNIGGGIDPASYYVTDYDFGVISATIGYGDKVYEWTPPSWYLPEHDDLWDGLVPNPPLYLEDTELTSIESIFSYINSLDLVNVLFVPVCVGGLVLFGLRIVLWRDT